MGAKPMLIHTGQHYEPSLSQVFFDELGLPEPNENLGVGSGTHARQTAALMVALEELMVDLTPERVVVYGDVNSTLAATLVAAKLHVPVAHVEAGLRSFDRSMPEELNRVVTDALSDLHFTTSAEAADHLAAEGVSPDGVYFVGNPMIDTLLRFKDALDVEGARSRFQLDEDYAVVTLHRPSNVDDPGTARDLVRAFGAVASEIPVVLPLHPRGRENLDSAGLAGAAGLIVTEPLPYLEFMALVAGARLVLTDSGGLQEETTVLGVPCLTLRDNTERPVTVELGTNQLVGRDPDLIYKSAMEVLRDPPRGTVPPLWDGQAGVRIAGILQR